MSIRAAKRRQFERDLARDIDPESPLKIREARRRGHPQIRVAINAINSRAAWVKDMGIE